MGSDDIHNLMGTAEGAGGLGVCMLAPPGHPMPTGAICMF